MEHPNLSSLKKEGIPKVIKNAFNKMNYASAQGEDIVKQDLISNSTLQESCLQFG